MVLVVKVVGVGIGIGKGVEVDRSVLMVEIEAQGVEGESAVREGVVLWLMELKSFGGGGKGVAVKGGGGGGGLGVSVSGGCWKRWLGRQGLPYGELAWELRLLTSPCFSSGAIASQKSSGSMNWWFLLDSRMTTEQESPALPLAGRLDVGCQ